MRTTLGILVRFVLWLLAFTVASAALVATYGYVTGIDSVTATTVGAFARVVSAVATVLSSSVVLAAAVTIFSILKHASRPILPLLILSLAATGMLFVAAFIQPDSGSTPVAGIPEKTIVRIDDTRIYGMSRSGLVLGPVILHDVDRTPGFQVAPEAVIDPDARDVIVPTIGRALDLSRASSGPAGLVGGPRLLAPVLADIRELTAVTSMRSANRVMPAAIIAAIGVFLYSLWTWVRMTRWPLFNAVMVYAALRCVLWLNRAVHAGPLREMMVAAVGSDSLGYVVAVAIGAIGLIVIASSVLLAPYSHWRREVNGE